MTRITKLETLLILIFILGPFPVLGKEVQDKEKLKVVTTLSFLTYIAQEIGGNHVTVQSLSNPMQDPHFVQPRPTLMKKTREADVFIEVGLQLELWAQKVIDGAGNLKIQTGQPGRVIASKGIQTLEVPQVVSREWGDIHPYGNPHVWLDPINAKRIATNIAQAFQRIDNTNQEDYAERLHSFHTRIDYALFGSDLVKSVGGKKLSRLAEQGTLFEYLERKDLTNKLDGWLKKAESLRGQKIVTYHKTWIYFAKRFGLEIPIEIEEKPGITPSAKHRDTVIQIVKQSGIKVLLLSIFYNRSAAVYIAEQTMAGVVPAPIDTDKGRELKTYFDLIDNIIDSIISAT